MIDDRELRGKEAGAHVLFTCCASLVRSLGLSEPLIPAYLRVRNEMLDVWGAPTISQTLTLYFITII